MKFILLLSVFFATQAQAIELTDLTALPKIQNVKLDVLHGPSMAAVQPVGVVNFSYTSCSQRSFDAMVEEIDDVYYVQIIDGNNPECKGPATERAYTVQYSSDAKGTEGVVILNPQSAVSPKQWF